MSNEEVNKNNENKAYSNGIYDTALLKSFVWDIILKNDKGSASSLGYNVNLEVLRNNEDKTLNFATSLTCRFSFDDVLKLDVEVISQGKVIVEKMFEFNKQLKEQNFELAIEDQEKDVDLKTLVLKLALRVFPNGYITKWTGTETDLCNPDRAHNVVLIVGNSRFYVLKEYLATWSRYFDRLFYGGFAEQNQKEVKLEDVLSHHFGQLLELIHPDRSTYLTDENVINIFKLADRFEMPSVMSQCGEYLENFDKCKNMKLIDRLEMADKYNLASLLLKCFKKIHAMSDADFRKFREENRQKLKDMSRNTLANII